MLNSVIIIYQAANIRTIIHWYSGWSKGDWQISKWKNMYFTTRKYKVCLLSTQPLQNCMRAIKITAKLHRATSIIMIIPYFKNIVLRLQVPSNGKQAISRASRTIPWEACRCNPYLTSHLYYSIMIVKISGLRSKWKYPFLGSRGSKKCEMHEKGFWNFLISTKEKP